MAHNQAQAQQPASQESEFSLAAHLFGFPAADNCYSPQEEPPGPWLDEFAANHADSDVFLGLFSSCRSGCEWALTRAKTVTIRLDMTVPHSTCPYTSVHREAVDALCVRREQPTALVFLCDSSVNCGQNILDFFKSIFDYEPHISALSFLPAPPKQPVSQGSTEDSDEPPSPTRDTYFDSLGYDLDYDEYAEIYPDMTGVYVDEARLLEFMEPYISQITHLEFSAHLLGDQQDSDQQDGDEQGGVGYEPPWTWLWMGQDACNNLTHFTTTFALTSELLGLLVSRAPALTHVSVGWLSPTLSDFSAKQWALQSLTLTSQEVQPSVRDLVKLPKSTHDRVDITCAYGHISFHTGAEGLSPAIAAERLPGWRFNLKHIFIEAPPASVSQHDSATAVVQQLEQLQAPTATIHLQRWRWDADVAHVVAGAMPQLTHLQFAVRINGQLTDSLLGYMLQLGQGIRKLTVDSLSLQSDTHANTPWPWDQLDVGTGDDMTQLLRLPTPVSRGEPPTITCFPLTISADTKIDALTRLSNWLPHVVWNVRTPMTLKCPPNGTNMTLLRAQLSVLRSVRLASTEATQKASVYIDGLVINSAAMDALRTGLPEWGGKVHLLDCTFPLNPDAYTQLAQCVPVSYQTWHLGRAANAQVIASICAGLNQRRAGLGLPPVTVRPEAHRQARRVVGEHVALLVARPQY